MSAADFTIDNISPSESTKSDVRNTSRPMSVKVTDYSFNQVNPSPVKNSKGCDLLEEFLSPRKLQALTGVDDLETVEYLEMRVNTEQMSLGNFGMYLPNLGQIKLSGSYITSIRDLGTSLWSLQVLWMPQCSLQCLDGLVTMSNIKELYLAYNQIEDISSCGMLENLEILDLEGNLIDDLTNIHYLSICPVLSRLTLEGNPLCNPDKYVPPQTYRSSIFDIVPQLKFLDDLSPNIKSRSAAGDIDDASMEFRDTSNATLEFEDHWNFINTVLVESGLLAESERSQQCDQSPRDSGRPSSSQYTGSSRPSTSLRPTSAQRPLLTSGMARPLSSCASHRPGSGTTVDSGLEVEERTGDSSLTAGKIVCGSVTKCLRRKQAEERRRQGESIGDEASVAPRPGAVTARSQDTNVEETCDIVLKELDEWRRDYERSKTRIEQQRAPQVLTLDYSEDDIEELSLPPKATSQPPPARTDKTTRRSKDSRSEIRLNPLKNGKVVPETKLPSSWVPRAKATDSAAVAPVSAVPPLSLAQAAPQMSRIRRQLLESGVATVTPSRPVFKKRLDKDTT